MNMTLFHALRDSQLGDDRVYDIKTILNRVNYGKPLPAKNVVYC